MNLLSLFRPAKRGSAKIAHQRLMKLIIDDVDPDLLRALNFTEEQLIEIQREIIEVIRKHTGVMIQMDQINFHKAKVDGGVRLEVSIPFNPAQEDASKNDEAAQGKSEKYDEKEEKSNQSIKTEPAGEAERAEKSEKPKA